MSAPAHRTRRPPRARTLLAWALADAATRLGRRADFEAAVAIHPTEAEEFVTFGGWGQRAPAAPGAPKVPMLPTYVAAPLAATAAARRQRAQLALAFAAGAAVAAAVLSQRR